MIKIGHTPDLNKEARLYLMQNENKLQIISYAFI